MRYILLPLLVIGLTLLYYILRIIHTKSISKELMRATTLYNNESNDYTKTLLILGDSTAVGVGASTSTDSIPALLAKKINATYVENHAVSGSVVASLPQQIQKIKRGHYNVILVQIGANDIVARNDVVEVNAQLEVLLTNLRTKADTLIFFSAGNLGGARAIPFFLKPYYRNLSLDYHKYFQALADKLRITYVNLYEDPKVDPFITNSETYFARDGFHPSSQGYARWFEMIEKKL